MTGQADWSTNMTGKVCVCVHQCVHVGVCDVIVGNKLARAVRIAVGGIGEIKKIKKTHAGFNKHRNNKHELHPSSLCM